MTYIKHITITDEELEQEAQELATRSRYDTLDFWLDYEAPRIMAERLGQPDTGSEPGGVPLGGYLEVDEAEVGFCQGDHVTLRGTIFITPKLLMLLGVKDLNTRKLLLDANAYYDYNQGNSRYYMYDVYGPSSDFTDGNDLLESLGSEEVISTKDLRDLIRSIESELLTEAHNIIMDYDEELEYYTKLLQEEYSE